MKAQNEKQGDWLEEDKKKFLDTNVTLKEINKFLSADFEMTEINNERKINQGKICSNFVKLLIGMKLRKLRKMKTI